MAKAETEAYRPAALAHLLAATIERLLEHERRLNSLKLRVPPRGGSSGV